MWYHPYGESSSSESPPHAVFIQAQPLGDRQVAGDLLHHRNGESPKQGDAARETLGKVDLAPHGALGNGPHFGTHAGTVGQLVD